MKLVVDEWLWADAGGDNGPERQKDSLRFLEAVFQRCDKIVIPNGTPFVDKFHELCKRAGSNHAARAIVRYFEQKFGLNPDKGEIPGTADQPTRARQPQGPRQVRRSLPRLHPGAQPGELACYHGSTTDRYSSKTRPPRRSPRRVSSELYLRRLRRFRWSGLFERSQDRHQRGAGVGFSAEP